ncbi:diphosphomevalonate decarboxylase [Candidatus Beckwithbacteria bacterium]|nr:diphosphomevalonate decarboxylase [Candidatus Beckwithbacteria bacterium]
MKKHLKATAHANISMALVKYWGKRDETLILPQNSNLAITWDQYGSTTTVEFNSSYKRDIFTLDGQEFKEGEEYDRVIGQLNLARKLAKIKLKAKVVSQNEVETQAGLASSASGAAALAAASAKAAGLNLNSKQLSILSRQGSGSSCRSILGGFVEWQKGSKADGSDSYAVQLYDENYWPQLCMLTVVVSTKKKELKTRAGMKQTVATCPFYPCWLATVEQDLKEIKQAIKAKNFTKMGEISEHNALKLHALMLTTKPSIIYWLPETVELIHQVQNWRDEGLEAYFTIDAGPQIKILALEKNVSKIKQRLNKLQGVKKVVTLKPGKGVEYLSRHLF